MSAAYKTVHGRFLVRTRTNDLGREVHEVFNLAGKVIRTGKTWDDAVKRADEIEAQSPPPKASKRESRTTVTRRDADRVDGYDRDDLGESPDG